jgi:hypothetical protein
MQRVLRIRCVCPFWWGVQAKAEAAKIAVFELIDHPTRVDPMSFNGVVPSKRAQGHIEVGLNPGSAMVPGVDAHMCMRMCGVVMPCYFAVPLPCGSSGTCPSRTRSGQSFRC